MSVQIFNYGRGPHNGPGGGGEETARARAPLSRGCAGTGKQVKNEILIRKTRNTSRVMRLERKQCVRKVIGRNMMKFSNSSSLRVRRAEYLTLYGKNLHSAHDTCLFPQSLIHKRIRISRERAPSFNAK